MTSQEDSVVMRPGANQNSTFSLRARKWDRELVCVASDPRSGESYNATLTLNVQCEYRWHPQISLRQFSVDTVNKGLSSSLLSPSPARDPQHRRSLQWSLGPRPLPGPLCLGAVQPACHHHLCGPVRPAGGQHLRLSHPGLTKLPLADQSHAEGHAQQPIREYLTERQQQRGNGAKQPHTGRSLVGERGLKFWGHVVKITVHCRQLRS